MKLTGGCLCGAVRFEIDGEMTTEGAGFCHCRLCQRSSGAPVMAWASFHRADLRFTAGAPARFRSSPHAERGFCRDCGSQLTFAYTEGPPFIDVALACLDQPDAILPSVQIWTASRRPWLDRLTDLPAFPDGGRDYAPAGTGADGSVEPVDRRSAAGPLGGVTD